MNSPPKKAPGAGEQTGRKLLIDLAAYHALDLVQVPFRLVFWRIEQVKARIQDRVDNARGAQ